MESEYDGLFDLSKAEHNSLRFQTLVNDYKRSISETVQIHLNDPYALARRASLTRNMFADLLEKDQYLYRTSLYSQEITRIKEAAETITGFAEKHHGTLWTPLENGEQENDESDEQTSMIRMVRGMVFIPHGDDEFANLGNQIYAVRYYLFK